MGAMGRFYTALKRIFMYRVVRALLHRISEAAKNYNEAGRVLGICHDTVVRMVKQGHLKVTPTKRILVRAAAAWAYGLQSGDDVPGEKQSIACRNTIKHN